MCPCFFDMATTASASRASVPITYRRWNFFHHRVSPPHGEHPGLSWALLCMERNNRVGNGRGGKRAHPSEGHKGVGADPSGGMEKGDA